MLNLYEGEFVVLDFMHHMKIMMSKADKLTSVDHLFENLTVVG